MEVVDSLEMEIAGDATSLDPELLQLPEVSALALKTSPHIAEELFVQWLSLPETGRLVKSLLVDASVNTHRNSFTSNAVRSNTLPSSFHVGNALPVSPISASGSPSSMKQKTSPFSVGSALKLVIEPLEQVIPQFYFQNGRLPLKELKEQSLTRINHLFSGN